MVKGGYLDCSHFTKLRNIYHHCNYMRKQYKSPVIKNNKITKKIFLNGVSLKATWPLKLFLDFAPEIKNNIVGISNG